MTDRIHFSEFEHLLGYVPDTAIANRAGCHVNSVINARARLGIPAPRPLGPSRPYQMRIPLELLDLLRAEDQRRVDAGWPPNLSRVIRDALEVGLEVLAERAV